MSAFHNSVLQVREQSKSIAAQVRQRVDDEQRRQMDIVERIKAEEIRAWKQKHGLHSPNRPTTAAPAATHVGEAHAAAKLEIAEEYKLRGRIEANRRAAMRRGREALARLDAERLQQEQAKADKRKRSAVTATTAQKRTKSAPKTKVVVQAVKSVASKNAGTQVGDSILDVNQYNCAQNTAIVCLNSSSASEDSLYQKDGVQPKSTANKSACVVDVDELSDTLSSSLEIEAEARKLSQALPLIAAVKKSTTMPHNTEAASATVAAASPVPGPVSPIRAATEMIRNRRSQQNNMQPINWFAPSGEQISAPVEPLSVATAWSSGLRTNVPNADKPIKMATNRPMPANRQTLATNAKEIAATGERVEPLKQRNRSPNKRIVPGHRQTSASPSKRTVVPPVTTLRKTPTKQPQFVPQFNRPTTAAEREKLSAMAKSSEERQTATEKQARVQYYDHANRFSKEYDAPADVVHVDVANRSAPNAMQAAVEEKRREEQLAAKHAKMR